MSAALLASLQQLTFGVVLMLLTLLPFLAGACWQAVRANRWRAYALDLEQELDDVGVAPPTGASPRLAAVPDQRDRRWS